MATNAAGIDASIGQHTVLLQAICQENALIELSRQTVMLRRQQSAFSFSLVEASCKFQLQPHHVMKAAATRRKIFAYLLLFFRSVVQLISAQCAPVAHFRITYSGARQILQSVCAMKKKELRMNENEQIMKSINI